MNIAIVGAGVIGVTTAYELASDGHRVTVFERHGSVAEEASFANAGVVAPGYVTPWAAPGMPGKVLSYLLRRHAPVKLRWPLSAAEIAWGWRWWRACDAQTYARNRAHMQRLALYSRERLHHLSVEAHLEYERSEGYLVLLRSERDRALAQPGLQLLRNAGIRFAEIDAAQARRIEPALNPDTDFVSAVHLPDDEVGNCRQFTVLLRERARALGVAFHFDAPVARLAATPEPTLWLAAEDAARRFDAVVVCAGLHSAALLRPLGLRLPLAAVHGYSVSARIREPLNAPRSAVMDERFKVAISRLGQRVRVAGSAELGGAASVLPDDTLRTLTTAQLRYRSLPAASVLRDDTLRTLYKVLQDWFPGAADFANGVQEWKGARPMLPDGPPLIGPSGLSGIWLNLGHGSSGWALSCGSARALADRIAGRTPEIDLEGLGVERLGLRI